MIWSFILALRLLILQFIDVPPSPNHKLNFPADDPPSSDVSAMEFEEDPQEDPEEEPKEYPQEDPKEEPEEDPQEDPEDEPEEEEEEPEEAQ
nr:hypothetical protein [Tanacetum cinerariifolium]